MSPAWLKLIAVLSLSCTALCDQEKQGVGGEVVWKERGAALTIKCKSQETYNTQLSLMKGLKENTPVLFWDGSSGHNTISNAFKDRLEVDGVFPNLDIHIKNITAADTGPYWCKYAGQHPDTKRMAEMKGTGSVLLVVKEPVTKCEPEDKKLVLVAVVISAFVLLGIIMGFSIWLIIKTKSLRSRVEKKREDVYEDMRGTIRR